MLWLLLGLVLLLNFVMSWKREGIVKAILYLVGIVSVIFAFFNPFNGTFNHTIFLPALFIGILPVIVSFILWLRDKKRKPK
jgi:uncharacterized membrane protein